MNQHTGKVAVTFLERDLIDAKGAHGFEEINRFPLGVRAEDVIKRLPAQVLLHDYILEFDPNTALVDGVFIANGSLLMSLDKAERLINQTLRSFTFNRWSDASTPGVH